ncbi:MAG TPA: hypothetical protein PLD55_05900 [bacterium]|jgi:hypothetical protein|nr:hypothetical protein [bacterium]HQI03843.1 hypothetical protein [bacterium]HQM84202.1 hypothetical protein [bacterium]
MNLLKGLFIILAGTIISAVSLGLIAFIITVLMPDLMTQLSKDMFRSESMGGADAKQAIVGITMIISAILGFVISTLIVLTNGIKVFFKK